MNSITSDSTGEWLQAEGCMANDVAELHKRLATLSKQRGLTMHMLGEVDSWPILMLTPEKLFDVPRVLVAGGFHGDEPAGSWGIVRFLQTPTLIDKINLSFLPIVNPTGFERVTRKNRWGEDPNRGFYHTKSGNPEPSREGRILLDHLTRIAELSKDIFVSLHEDWEFSKFYIYTFENGPSPGTFSEALRKAEEKYFDAYPDGPLEGGIVKDGVIFRLSDGSFEDFLFHSGARMTACTETPGKLDLETRIQANSTIINELVRYAGSLHTRA